MRGPARGILSWFFWLAALTAGAQPARPPQPDPLLQLLMSQPSIEIATNVQATATFDPPAVGPGETATWRVTFSALDESVRWPDAPVAPPELELRLSARGQTLLTQDGKLQPKTAINYHVRATNTGRFTIPEFETQAYGRPVIVPAATLEVVSPPPPHPPPLRLFVELSETNVYVGQPVNLRVRMPVPSGPVRLLMELRLNGEGFLVDQGVARHNIGVFPFRGQSMPSYLYESVLTPLTVGTLTISAQAFDAGNRFSYPLSIQGQVTIAGGPPQYILLDSDPVMLHVRPLPPAGERPGFTGAVGRFACDPPQLSTNQVRVGDSISLTVVFRGAGNLSRFVAPRPPTSGPWQMFDPVAAGISIPPPAASPGLTNNSITFVYSMTPLTTEVASTPSIPFSYFDPDSGEYVDLPIASLPVQVLPGATPVDEQALLPPVPPALPEEKKPTLSELARSPGRGADSLVPLQQRGGFVLVQILPVMGLVGLWGWDRRRRFLEQHPDIVLRRRARRALRREQRALRKAFHAGDAPRYAAVAVRAMRVATAPHFPAEPRALVGSDVLEVLGGVTGDNGRAGTVRRFFAVADASQFSGVATDAPDLFEMQPELLRVLAELEARL